MPISWEYGFQYTLNRFSGRSLFDQPIDLILLGALLVAFVFLIGIIRALYKDYKKTETVETLLFLLGMITLIPANIFGIVTNLCYSTLGMPEIAEIITIINLFPMQFTYLCVNLFAIRMTFPKRYKLILVILLILSVIMIGTVTWAITKGPPYFNVINFAQVYSLNIQIIRFICLIPVAVIPISVFYYYATKVREENRATSNRSIWLGTGILSFAIAVIIPTVAVELRVFQALYVPAAIIFYVCFSMPDWFKRRIGWTK
ncbi:MAG: hypothetical protein HWN67_16865 [Candidatus Helarchaeota archaeon]|nr:hypothetical protein [Candidatus Helarchaeota archaeon]